MNIWLSKKFFRVGSHRICQSLKKSFVSIGRQNCSRNTIFVWLFFCKLRRGLIQQQCIDEFNSIFDDETPSRTSVYWWYGELHPGRSSLQDEFREGHTQFVKRSKKSFVSIGRKKCSRNTIAVLRNTSMISWHVMNRVFKRMSPKVNSSWLYGCFKMSQIQQNLLAHEALSSKWSPVFGEKLDISQS